MHERILCKEWKLTIAQINNTNIPSRFENLIINFKPNKHTYNITINDTVKTFGKWELNPTNKEITLRDEKKHISHVLNINIINKHQISIQDFKHPEITLFFAPIKNKKQLRLTPKEHLICRAWNISKSSENNNLGTLFEFFPDNRFTINSRSSESEYQGSWALSESQKTLILTDNINKQNLNLKIKSITPSSLTLYNPITNKETSFHNKEFVKKDRYSYKKLALISVPIFLLLFSSGLSSSP